MALNTLIWDPVDWWEHIALRRVGVHAFSFASNDAQYRVVRSFTDDGRYSDTLRPKKEDDDLARRGISERLSRKRLIREDEEQNELFKIWRSVSIDWPTTYSYW